MYDIYFGFWNGNNKSYNYPLVLNFLIFKFCMKNYHKPALGEPAFTCPHCECFGEMSWGDYKAYLFAPSVKRRSIVRSAYCNHCGLPTIWVDDAVVYPTFSGIQPNDEMPDLVKKTFVEAQSIYGLSPRGTCILLRLCLEQLLTHLGYKQKTLAEKIKSSCSQDPVSDKVMEALRIAGNAFVHSGDLEEFNNKDFSPSKTALILTNFINYLVEKLIVLPKQATDIMDVFEQKPRL